MGLTTLLGACRVGAEMGWPFRFFASRSAKADS
jgi:hypothetical protein